jgi:3-oxoacyl-[acyl-carrier protein] reductase
MLFVRLSSFYLKNGPANAIIFILLNFTGYGTIFLGHPFPESLLIYFHPEEFQGQTALVTGGTRGIGRAVSLGLSFLGADLVVGFQQDLEAARRLEKEIRDRGRQCLLIPGDVSSQSHATEMVQQALERSGRIDILVNNAGRLRDRLFLFMEETDWDGVLEVNLKGVYRTCRAVLKTMIGQRFGRIINLASPSALLGRAGQTNYAAAKGGVISFTRSLARELAHLNITVNAVSPGVIRTEMVERLPDKVKRDLLRGIPFGRWGSPEEVAGAVLFLASRRAAYLTGQILAVDGGLT